MANSLDSYADGATEIQRSFVGASVMLPSLGELQSPEGGGCAPEDREDAFDDSGNNVKQGVVVPGQADANPGVVEEPDGYDAILANKTKMDVAEFEEQAADEIQEEKQVRCSEKCALKIQVIEDTALVDTSLPGTGEFNRDDNCVNMNRKRPEIEEKKEKRSKRRGGKARNKKDILNCNTYEKKEKEFRYSRKEMEALRYQQLEYQKKKWIEVFCGLHPLVAQEYEGLIEFEKNHLKHSVSSFDFDPRPQFLKSANLGEDCLRSDPASIPPVSDEMGCSVVDGVCSNDDDSDEDCSSIQKPAFLVTGEPDFDSGPPLDGLEYLRRVRWEAARIPKVTVAKVNRIKEQSLYMPQIPDIVKCSENLLPLKEWEDSFLADFSELRRAFSSNSSIKSQPFLVQDNLVEMLESATSEKFDSLTSTYDDSGLLEASGIVGSNDKINLANASSSDHPTLSAILGMDSAARTAMLKRRISMVEKMSSIPRDDSLCLFALCALVDCPLDAHTSAALRSLLRKCASLRAAKTEIDDEVIILNILVTISGRYFGQLEK